jgi:hypothetical protein
MKTIMTITLVSLLGAGPAAQGPPHAMGFDQATTAHHFLLASDGGSIEVTTKDPADAATRDQIRNHLRQIARDFAAGNFARPRETHGETPPGASVMSARRDAIDYTFEDLPAGGRVRIRTRDAKARAAIHDFLRYQIRAHRTGDATTAR